MIKQEMSSFVNGNDGQKSLTIDDLVLKNAPYWYQSDTTVSRLPNCNSQSHFELQTDSKIDQLGTRTINDLDDPIVDLNPKPKMILEAFADFRYGLSEFGLFCPILGQSFLGSQTKKMLQNSMEKLSLGQNTFGVNNDDSCKKSQSECLLSFQNKNLLQTLVNWSENPEDKDESEDAKSDISRNSDESHHKSSIQNTDSNEYKVPVDVSELQEMTFKDVKEVRERINEIFAPKNVKMICKRAERIYSNFYCVFVLYCHKWAKRGPTYRSSTRYRKQSTNCPFQLKFTKHKRDDYRLTDGVFFHNHELDTPVLMPSILKFIRQFDPYETKAAEVRKLL